MADPAELRRRGGLAREAVAERYSWATIAERLAEQAALELDEERQIRSLLAEAELRHELGELSDDELEQIEDGLLERLQQVGELDAADWRA